MFFLNNFHLHVHLNSTKTNIIYLQAHCMLKSLTPNDKKTTKA